MKVDPLSYDDDGDDADVVERREPAYSAEQMRLLLPKAKQFKSERIAEIRAQIQEARTSIGRLERELERWEKMVPYDVFPVMEANEGDAARNAEDEEQQQRLARLHSDALYEAYARSKGLLPPEVCSAKLFKFCIVGATIGALLAMYAGWYQFFWRSEWVSMALGCLGGVLGFVAGFKFFSLNFVEDKGLDVSDHWARMNHLLIHPHWRRRV
jgi:hypothetical protein